MTDIDFTSVFDDWCKNIGCIEENLGKDLSENPFEPIHFDRNILNNLNNDPNSEGLEFSPSASLSTDNDTSLHNDLATGAFVTPDAPCRYESPHQSCEPLYPNMACQLYNGDDLAFPSAQEFGSPETHCASNTEITDDLAEIISHNIFDIDENYQESVPNLLGSFGGFDKSLADLVDDVLPHGTSVCLPTFSRQKSNTMSEYINSISDASSWLEANGIVKINLESCNESSPTGSPTSFNFGEGSEVSPLLSSCPQLYNNYTVSKLFMQLQCRLNFTYLSQ